MPERIAVRPDGYERLYNRGFLQAEGGNDPKDAQVILHMLEIEDVQVFHDPLVAGTSDIQELSRTYEMVARAKTELWHRILTHYLLEGSAPRTVEPEDEPAYQNHTCRLSL